MAVGEDNEVGSVYAEYESQSGEFMIMNYTLRRPVTGETGWTHGQPIPWIDPQGQLDQTEPQIPTGEPYSSAANVAREYYRQLGYAEEAGMTIQSARADYSAEGGKL